MAAKTYKNAMAADNAVKRLHAKGETGAYVGYDTGKKKYIVVRPKRNAGALSVRKSKKRHKKAGDYSGKKQMLKTYGELKKKFKLRRNAAVKKSETDKIRAFANRLGISFARASSLWSGNGGDAKKAAAMHREMVKRGNPTGPAVVGRGRIPVKAVQVIRDSKGQAVKLRLYH